MCRQPDACVTLRSDCANLDIDKFLVGVDYGKGYDALVPIVVKVHRAKISRLHDCDMLYVHNGHAVGVLPLSAAPTHYPLYYSSVRVKEINTLLSSS